MNQDTIDKQNACNRANGVPTLDEQIDALNRTASDATDASTWNRDSRRMHGISASQQMADILEAAGFDHADLHAACLWSLAACLAGEAGIPPGVIPGNVIADLLETTDEALSSGFAMIGDLYREKLAAQQAEKFRHEHAAKLAAEVAAKQAAARAYEQARAESLKRSGVQTAPQQGTTAAPAPGVDVVFLDTPESVDRAVASGALPAEIGESIKHMMAPAPRTFGPGFGLPVVGE